ncbi:hypothetical protein HDU67_000258, partial [Dinochytrium kinnereticum]
MTEQSPPSTSTSTSTSPNLSKRGSFLRRKLTLADRIASIAFDDDEEQVDFSVSGDLDGGLTPPRVRDEDSVSVKS